MANDKTVNGVDAGKLKEAIRAIGADPEAGKCAFRAHSTWPGGLRTESTIRDFRLGGKDTPHRQAFNLKGDEPNALLGEDTAPNATEAALHALACCVTATFMYHAALRGVEVDDLRIDLEGDVDLRGLLALSDSIPIGFQDIRLSFHVRSSAPREQVEELCGLAQKYSPVFNTFANRTPLSSTVDFAPSSGQRAA